MTKKKANAQTKTDKIRIKAVKIKTLKTMYKVSFQVVINGKDGKAKDSTPFFITHEGREIFSGTSNAKGLARFEHSFKFLPTLETVDLLCKITGSSAEDLSCTFQLPAPSEIKFTRSSVRQNEHGAFTSTFTVNAKDKQGKPRPNCKIIFSGNGQSKTAYTNANGNISFEDDTITKKQANDKLLYSVQSGHLSDSSEIQVPLWKKGQSVLSKRFNDSPNWKHNRKETISFVIQTLLVFSVILLLSSIFGTIGRVGACLLIGAVLYWRSNDEEGNRSFVLPIIVTLFCLAIASSIPFVSTMIILSLVVFVWEEWSRPIDTETNEGLTHPQNPYPKWPIMFGLFMTALLLACSVPDFYRHSTSLDISQLNTTQHAEQMLKTLNQKSNFRPETPQFLSNLWNNVTSIKNWLVFSLIIGVYASPKEIMDFMQKGSGGGAGAAGIEGIFYALKDLLEPLFSWLIRRRKRR